MFRKSLSTTYLLALLSQKLPFPKDTNQLDFLHIVKGVDFSQISVDSGNA